MTDLVAFVRGCPKIDGVEEILLPGDPERNVLINRKANGVPFDEGNWKQLLDLATTLEVEPPAAK